MVSDEELDYLHRLTRDAWSGSAGVVEMGPWLGGSTWALARGMEENRDREPTARLHVIDNFVWQPFMAERAGLQLAAGASFRQHFEANLRPKGELLVVHEAALPDDDSCDAVHDVGFVDAEREVPVLTESHLPPQVEIALVDGAKSWGGLLHLMGLLAPRLIPGRSTIVFQDFKNWSSYWIPLYAAMLVEGCDPYLELVDVLESNSVSFRVRRDLAASKRVVPSSLHELPAEEARRLFDRSAQLLEATGDVAGARIVELAEIAFLGSRGSWDVAGRRLREVEGRWPLTGAPLTHPRRTREWLERHCESCPPRSRRLRLIQGRRRIAGAVRRRVA